MAQFIIFEKLIITRVVKSLAERINSNDPCHKIFIFEIVSAGKFYKIEKRFKLIGYDQNLIFCRAEIFYISKIIISSVILHITYSFFNSRADCLHICSSYGRNSLCCHLTINKTVCDHIFRKKEFILVKSVIHAADDRCCKAVNTFPAVERSFSFLPGNRLFIFDLCINYMVSNYNFRFFDQMESVLLYGRIILIWFRQIYKNFFYSFTKFKCTGFKDCKRISINLIIKDLAADLIDQIIIKSIFKFRH